MNAQRIPSLQALSFLLGTAALTGCGGGAFYAEAPGVIFEEEEDEPPIPKPDAGQPKVDSGPPPTPTDGGCVTITRPVTEEEDLAAFAGANIASFFGATCVTCHGGGSPSGEAMTWGAPEANVEGWFDACSTLLTLPRNQGKPLEETTLYAAFNGTVKAPYTGNHPENPAAKAALQAWVAAREGESETICDEGPGPGTDPNTDAGPGGDPDPGPGPGALPTKAESESCFLKLDVAPSFLACRTCHAGSNYAPTNSGETWGSPEGGLTTSPSPSGWHDAVWALTSAERGSVTVESSTLYINLNGTQTHNKYPPARDASVPWLDYVLNGVLPGACQ